MIAQLVDLAVVGGIKVALSVDLAAVGGISVALLVDLAVVGGISVALLVDLAVVVCISGRSGYHLTEYVRIALASFTDTGDIDCFALSHELLL